MPPVRPIQQIIDNPAKIEVERNTGNGSVRGRTNSTSQKEIFSFTPDEPKKPTTNKAPTTNNKSGGDLGSFFDFTETTTNPQPSNGGFEDDFPVDFGEQEQQPKKATKSGLSLADDLFKNITPTVPTNQFAYGQTNQFGAFQQNQFASAGGFQSVPNQFGNYPPQQNQFGMGFTQAFGGYPPQQQFGGAYPPQQNQFGGPVSGTPQGGYAQPNQFGSYPPQQQFSGAYPPQQNQFGGPVPNPLLTNNPKQNQPTIDSNDDLFSDLGLHKPNQPNQSLKPQQQQQQNWNQRPAPTSHVVEDNPFDF